jgi:peptide/nickel transport system ATP-binding protein
MTEAARAQGRLEIQDLSVVAHESEAEIVTDVSVAVESGETVGIVGESGSGKTTVALSTLGFARRGTRIAGGSVRLGTVDVLACAESERRSLRGRVVAFVPQDPSTNLNPAMRVGRQLLETVETHFGISTKNLDRVHGACRDAQLAADGEFLRRYPHQLSGGQQQRVCIAMALVCDPKFIVMDEPTTGLDVTTQARVLEVITTLKHSREVGILYVTHDLGVVRNLADRVIVMYGGRVVESASTPELFLEPQHPYTRRLLEATPRVRGQARRLRAIPGMAVQPWNRPPGCPFAPRCDYRVERCDAEMPPADESVSRLVRCWRWHELPRRGTEAAERILLQLRDSDARSLRKTQASPGEAAIEIEALSAGYGRERSGEANHSEAELLAVAEVSFRVERGRCFAIAGESGSGKTTLLRCIAGLHAPKAGRVLFAGTEVSTSASRAAPFRRLIQLVPQNPDATLNPRHSVDRIVGRPLQLFFGLDRGHQRKRVAELLEQVRLRPSVGTRYSFELSGGEKQRVAIARAMAAEPDVLLCDEVTASLDVAVQAGILQLLEELRQDNNLTIVFVSHDLAVVNVIADGELLIMRHGKIQEQAPAQQVLHDPAHEYTKELIAAISETHVTDYPDGFGLPRPTNA